MTSNLLIKLQSAITDYQVILIDYVSLNGQQSQRDIEPFAFFSTNKKWILVAYRRLIDDFRAFRLNHIPDGMVGKSFSGGNYVKKKQPGET